MIIHREMFLDLLRDDGFEAETIDQLRSALKLQELVKRDLKKYHAINNASINTMRVTVESAWGASKHKEKLLQSLLEESQTTLKEEGKVI